MDGNDEKTFIKNNIPSIIDNGLKEFLLSPTLDTLAFKKKTMDLVINEIIEHVTTKRVRICTGYFSPHVWKLVGNKFASFPISTNNPTFELLIGSEVEGRATSDFQEWFNEQLQKELDDLDLDIELQGHIRSLIAFLERSDVFVALQKHPFSHGKMYWFPSVAIVGSSNFTWKGFKEHTELNIPIFEDKQIESLADWFDLHFKNADLSYKEKLVESLKNCKLGTTEWSPYDVYMKMLYEAYKPTISFEEMKTGFQLTLYQQEGVRRLLKAMADFGGAMLADSVGLGKSHQAIEVIRALQLKGKRRAVLICPAQLEHNWDNLIKSADIWADICTMETLARHLPENKTFDIVVIDESHNFRNNKTNRYKNLMLLLTKNPVAQVLLLTATPINTSLQNLYHQVMIISKSVNNYSPLFNVGIYDLKEYFKEIDQKQADIGTLRDHLIVSRSRREIRLRQKFFDVDLEINGFPIRFPERHLVSAVYAITDYAFSGMTSNEFYENIVNLLDELEFPYYNLEKYNVTEKPDESIIQLGINITSLMKVLLLKRLESSIIAFEKSIDSQTQLNTLFSQSVDRGVFISASKIWEIFGDIQADTEDTGEDPIQRFCSLVENPDTLNDYIEDIESPSFDASKIQKCIVADKQRLEKITSMVQQVKAHDDFKLKTFLTLIDSLPSKKILVFTYFKDTANYIFECVRKKRPLLVEETGKITGDTPDGERTTLVQRFAPLSNAEGNKNIQDLGPVLNLLISTDVLSEGQNLQDACVCINYDLHWNPVRLIQRIGRIDRLKSPHKEVWIYNFFPEEGLETLLGLVGRLVERLKLINQMLELDGAVLTGEELNKKKEQISRLQKADENVLDDLESEVELLADNKGRDMLLREIIQKGTKYFQRIPLGVYSGMKAEANTGVAVVVRVYRNNIPSILWGFEPDHPESYGEFLVHGLIPRDIFVQKIITCDPSTPRVFIESENICGDLFERVIDISKRLKELRQARVVTNKLEGTTPKGNLIYLKEIKQAETLCRKHSMTFPDTSSVKKFLSIRPIGIIAAEIRDAINIFKSAREEMEKAKKLQNSNEKTASERIFIDLLSDFIIKTTTYIEGNKVLETGEAAEKMAKESKYELIGFLRLYPVK